MGLLEYLKKILGDEEGQKAYDKISKDKDNKLIVEDNKNPKYVEKAELDTANQTIKDYKKQLKDRDTQLNDLQGKVKDNEELAKEIEKLKGDNEKVTKDYESKLNQITFDSKFEKAITGFKPKDTNAAKAIRALLDMEKVKLVDDTFIGLEEQIKGLKESSAYLFEQELPGGTGTLGGGQSSFSTGNDSGSIGEMLAKSKTGNQNNDAQNKFFS
jgi:hypothetical protein